MTVVLVAFTRDDVEEMMSKLARVSALTSDEPQSLAQSVHEKLRESVTGYGPVNVFPVISRGKS